jgi:predicted metal-dependent phosphoesterase TrpH
MPYEVMDLHSHSLHSDGSVSPSELVELAAQAGARAISLTDHDTTSGLAEARSAAARHAVEFINGIEVSADFQPGTMHILGYFIDDASETLGVALEELRRARFERNPQIAKRLESLGMDIPYEQVAALAGSEVVGRPHFARLMLEKGYVGSIKEAFDRYLAKGAAAYVEKKRLSPADSIALIHRAGGVAVLAHPYQLRLPWDELEQKVRELVDLGLDGIEAIYSRHSPDDRQAYSELALRLGLLITGGSDFHGSYKPDINIVSGLGDLQVPYNLLDQIKVRAAARREV